MLVEELTGVVVSVAAIWDACLSEYVSIIDNHRNGGLSSCPLCVRQQEENVAIP